MSKVTIFVKVFNHTNEDMILKDAHLEHGKWLDKPESIENGQEGDFMAENGISHNIDCHIYWNSKRTHSDFAITIDKPVEGTTRFNVDCPDCYRYTISGDPLEKHALVDVSFYKLELGTS